MNTQKVSPCVIIVKTSEVHSSFDFTFLCLNSVEGYFGGFILYLLAFYIPEFKFHLPGESNGETTPLFIPSLDMVTEVHVIHIMAVVEGPFQAI